MYKTIKVLILQLILSTSLCATTFYVSPLGNNNNMGTSESMPFQEVQYAIDQMSSGDTLIVLDGIYAEALKIKSGITIKAKNPRMAIFSGAEVMNNTFVKHSGNIYKTTVQREVKQLFYNEEPMLWARWPNTTWSENWIFNKKFITQGNEGAPGKLTSTRFNEIADLDIVGSYCFLRYSKGNSCFSRLVEAFDGTTLEWNDDNFYSTTYTGEDGYRGSQARIDKGKAKLPIAAKFFLAGAYDFLDAPGEWFVKDNTLYIYPTDGKDPNNAQVLVKTIDYTIYEEGTISDLTIEGIDFFASSVKLSSASNSNISFTNSYFTYIGTELLYINNVIGKQISKPIHVQGSNLLFEKCLFAGAQNSALDLKGSDMTINNCVFMENNRHANFSSRPLVIDPLGTYTLTNSTFFNNCSDAVSINAELDRSFPAPEIAYNNIFNAGLFHADVSGVYLPNLTQNWLEFHHNWVHNVKGNGLRLDQAGKKLTAHHNVFWSSKRGLNIEGYSNDVYSTFNLYNNTSVHNESPDFLTRNVYAKSKGNDPEDPSNDATFPPIDDWNVLNNLAEGMVDRVGPSEKSQFSASVTEGIVDPVRGSSGTFDVVDRGDIQDNMTGFSYDIFINGDLDGLNLIPSSTVVNGGAAQTAELANERVTSLDSFRGAYAVNDPNPWTPGSDWMPYGLDVLKTMDQSNKFALDYKYVSVVPTVIVMEKEPPVNLALSGIATQSSTEGEAEASLANDSITDGIFAHNSVSQTTLELNPWWQVELDTTYFIGDVIIYNRTDPCCMDHLSNFTISVIDSSGVAIDSNIHINSPVPSVITVNMNNVRGHIIKVQLTDTTALLSLAEVAVYEGYESIDDDDEAEEDNVESTNVFKGEGAFGNFNASGYYQLTKANAPLFCWYVSDSSAREGQSVVLGNYVENDSSSTWIEIDRNNGYYSYQKLGTGFCIDGGAGGANSQDVFLGLCDTTNEHQLWKKEDVGSGLNRLQKSDAEFVINGGSGGAVGQSVSLWKASAKADNLKWAFHSVDMLFSITIKVIDDSTDLALPDVAVRLNETTMQTGADGEVTFNDLEIADYAYELSLSGYDSLAGNIRLSKDETFTVAMRDTNRIPDEPETTQISENNIKDISMYPNPATDFLQIESLALIKNIRVYNNLGQLKNTFETDSRQFRLNTQDYKTGIYFLLLELGNYTIARYKYSVTNRP